MAHGHTWGLLPACSPKGEEHIRKLLCRNRLGGLSWKGTSQSRLFATASKQPACPQSVTGGEVKNSTLGGWRHHLFEGGNKSLFLCFSPQPVSELHQVHRCGDGDMSQVRFAKANVA